MNHPYEGLWIRHQVLSAIVGVCLMAIVGCGKSDPTPSAGPTIKDANPSLPQPAVAGNNKPEVSDDMKKAVDSFLGQTMLRQGERIFLPTDAARLLEFKGFHFGMYAKTPLTEADRLNGIRERQAFFIQFAASRRGNALFGTGWEEWKPPGPSGGVLIEGEHREQIIGFELNLLESGWNGSWYNNGVVTIKITFPTKGKPDSKWWPPTAEVVQKTDAMTRPTP